MEDFTHDVMLTLVMAIREGRIHGRPFGRFWAVDGDKRTLVAEVVVDAPG